jgi:hypothetical protein
MKVLSNLSVFNYSKSYNEALCVTDNFCNNYDIICSALYLRFISNKTIKITNTTKLIIDKCSDLKIIFNGKVLEISNSVVDIKEVKVYNLSLSSVKNLDLGECYYSHLEIHNCENIITTNKRTKTLLVVNSTIKLVKHCDVITLRNLKNVNLKNFSYCETLRIDGCEKIYSSKKIYIRNLELRKGKDINIKLVEGFGLQIYEYHKILLPQIENFIHTYLIRCNKVLCLKPHTIFCYLQLRDCKYINLNFNLKSENIIMLNSCGYVGDHFGRNLSQGSENIFLNKFLNRINQISNLN